jgi:hypothetical protein
MRMLKISLALFLIPFLGCATADKPSSKLCIDEEKVQATYTVELRYRYDDLIVDIKVIDDSNTSFFGNIINSIAVSSQESGFDYLLDNYYITFISVENTGRRKKSFNIASLRLKVDDEYVKPLSPEKFPKVAKRVNVKGQMKNIYNLAVVAAVTSYVVISVAMCAKDGKCEGLRYVGDVFEVSQSGEKDPKKLYSNFFHKMKYEYDKTLKTDNVIKPRETVSGIVFFKKREGMFDSFIKLFYARKKTYELKRIE